MVIRIKSCAGIAAMLALVALAGCSSSSSSGSTTAPQGPVASTSGPTESPSASAAADTTAPAETAAGASTGEDLATKGCSAIKIEHAQALVVATVTKIDFAPGSAELDPNHEFTCQFSDQAMLITIHPLDSSRQVYQEDVANQRGTDHPLAGIGDTAVWAGALLFDVVTGAPTVIAHKGAVTCEVESAGQHLTMTVDSGPIGGSTLAEAASFAAETGVLCNDIFAAIG